MRNPIWHALARLMAWLFPPTGARRRADAWAEDASDAWAAGPGERSWLPEPRSPYACGATERQPIDGTAVALVRPYVVASEKRQQQERRVLLALALDAIDADPFTLREALNEATA